MSNTSIYRDIAVRTGGNIYIGVVGPVRTGKSTFIKRFMETLVLPNIEDAPMRERARDELPQSGSGKTIMTAEPKFVPENAVPLSLSGAEMTVRLIDCVGYMVDGALGEFEGGEARMVATPWFESEIPMREAAETGTRKVVAEHSTVALVVTTDGTVGDIPRSAYEGAEKRVIGELKALGKPFLVLINSAAPDGEAAQELKCRLAEEYGVTCVVKSCLALNTVDIESILSLLLFEFPVTEIGVMLPPWVDALPPDSEIKAEVCRRLLEEGKSAEKISDLPAFLAALPSEGGISQAKQMQVDLATGEALIEAELPRGMFYKTLSEKTGFDIADDGALMTALCGLAEVKADYDTVRDALKDAREKGYGVVLPTRESLTLMQPEIVRRGGRYGVKLRATAPSIHMIRADVETEVSPGIAGSASEDIVGLLLQEFEGDSGKLWQSNVFGKPLCDIAGEGLASKLRRMPPEAQEKLQEALKRIVNEGSNGLICIIL